MKYTKLHSWKNTFKSVRLVYVGGEVAKETAKPAGEQMNAEQQLAAKRQELKTRATTLDNRANELAKIEKNPAISAKVAEAKRLVESVNKNPEGKGLNAAQIQANLSRMEALLSQFEQVKAALVIKSQIDSAMATNIVNAKGEFKAIYDEFLKQHGTDITPDARMKLDQQLQAGYAKIEATAKSATGISDIFIKQADSAAIAGLNQVLAYAKSETFTNVTIVPAKTEFRIQVYSADNKNIARYAQNYLDSAISKAKDRVSEKSKTDPVALSAMGNLNDLQYKYSVALADIEKSAKANPRGAETDRARTLQNFQAELDKIVPPEKVKHTNDDLVNLVSSLNRRSWVVNRPDGQPTGNVTETGTPGLPNS